jgi:hypothetical protein
MERKPFICLRPRAHLFYVFITNNISYTYFLGAHYRVAHTPRWCGFSFVFYTLYSLPREWKCGPVRVMRKRCSGHAMFTASISAPTMCVRERARQRYISLSFLYSRRRRPCCATKLSEFTCSAPIFGFCVRAQRLPGSSENDDCAHAIPS